MANDLFPLAQPFTAMNIFPIAQPFTAGNVGSLIDVARFTGLVDRALAIHSIATDFPCG